MDDKAVLTTALVAVIVGAIVVVVVVLEASEGVGVVATTLLLVVLAVEDWGVAVVRVEYKADCVLPLIFDAAELRLFMLVKPMLL